VNPNRQLGPILLFAFIFAKKLVIFIANSAADLLRILLRVLLRILLRIPLLLLLLLLLLLRAPTPPRFHLWEGRYQRNKRGRGRGREGGELGATGERVT
jgi:hypothetical protein